MTSLSAELEPPVVTDYLDYFGLHDDPFSSDSQLFYDGGSRRELFAELLHLCQFSASTLVILGEEGVGKASLEAELCRRFAEQDSICEIDVPALNSNEWFLNQVANQLSVQIDGSDQSQAIVEIRQFIQQGEDDDSLKVAMIQNAQNLNADTLKTLLRLAAPGDQNPYRQLHVLLFATPSFAEQIDLLEDQSLVQIFELPPITAKELKHYLRFRLDAVGFSGIFPFKESDIQFLWDISKGVPAKFHDAAREILIELALPPPESKSLGLPPTHMAAIVLLLAGLLMVFFYNSGSDSELESTEIAQSNSAQPNSTEISDNVNTSESTIEIPTRGISSEGSDSGSDGEEGVDVEAVATQELRTVSDKQDEPSVLELVIEAPEQIKAPPVLDPEDDIQALIAAAQEEIAQDQIAAPKPDTTIASMPTEPTGSIPEVDLTTDENLLLNREPKNFTLQILASGSRAAVDDFLKRQPNRDDLAVFTANRNNKTLYIVVMGSFPSSNDARLAVGQLPQEQQKAGPWPRSILSVQAEIRDFRGF